MTHDIKPGDWVRIYRENRGFTYGKAYQVKKVRTGTYDSVKAKMIYVHDDDGDYRPVNPRLVEPLNDPTDLTKIEKPFGLLDPETQERLKAWPHGWEVWNADGWRDTSMAFPLWRSFTYRAQPAPAEEPMQPPWNVLPEWVRYVAMDKDGDVFAYDGKPEIGSEYWGQLLCHCLDITHLRFPRGNIPWEKSLVERPND